MKREFLKGLGIEALTDEQIDKIMSEHGKSIEAEKAKGLKASEDLKARASELEAMKKTLTELEATNADSAKVKEELDKLKQDIAKNEADAAEQAELNKLYAEIEKLTPKDMQYLNDWSKNGIRDEVVKLHRAEPTKGLAHHYESLIKDDKGNYKEGVFTSGVKPGFMPPMGNTDGLNGKDFEFNFTPINGENKQK